MSATRYVDIPAIMQVIGAIYINSSLLDNEQYYFNEEDFTEEFHQIIFGSMYNLHELGAKEVTIQSIENYLEARPKKFAVYKLNKGREYLLNLKEYTKLAAFDYYYKRMKKMTLLRMYNEVAGLDLSYLYDIDNILDMKKKQAQEDWLDNTKIEDIADLIDKKITNIRLKYVDNLNDDFVQAGVKSDDLIRRLIQNPEIGYPLFGPLVNTITRGARLTKFYLRSAATGIGKTRALIADACNFGCDELYDPNTGKWELNGTKEPTLFIATEQDVEEIQTMMLAFIADVDEEHIVNGEYYEGELERVLKASQVLKDAPIYIKRLPDFSLNDIESCIKYSIQEYGVKYICFDYIHSSMKILSEVTSKTGVKGLREDNVLFMMSVKIKDICNQYGVFIISSTQLNGNYSDADVYDQNLLRGAKAIADKIDVGEIMLQVTQKDLDSLQPVLQDGGFETPAIKISVYKNRRSRYKDILLWCRDRRGVCKIEPMFVTNYNYELINIQNLKINVKPSSAF